MRRRHVTAVSLLLGTCTILFIISNNQQLIYFLPPSRLPQQPIHSQSEESPLANEPVVLLENKWKVVTVLPERPQEDVLQLGRDLGKTTFLTIGIASVYRSEGYLYSTVQSLINHSTAEERANTTLVVLLADVSQDVRYSTISQLKKRFARYIHAGLLRVIVPPADIYGNLDFSRRRRTYNDPPDRVAWRTKQVLDFAFLFSYCQHLSEYYLVLEDDLIAADRYITAIRDIISYNKNHDWVRLKTTEFLIIGNLIHSHHLAKLVQLMFLFNSQQPVDYIMNHFVSMMVNGAGVLEQRKPALFNHVGRRSTLPNKIQKLTDRQFAETRRMPLFRLAQNPAAHITIPAGSNLVVKDNRPPFYAYSPAPGHFWASVAVRPACIRMCNVSVLLRFDQGLTNVTQVGVVSGYWRGSVRVDRFSRPARLWATSQCDAQINTNKFGKQANLTATQTKRDHSWMLLGISDAQSAVLNVSNVQYHMPEGVCLLLIETETRSRAQLALSQVAVYTSSRPDPPKHQLP